MTIPKITDLVGGDKRVHFTSFKNEELWYKTDSGFEFSVPLADTAGAEFLSTDKASLFMRWIRKRIELLTLENSKNNLGYDKAEVRS